MRWSAGVLGLLVLLIYCCDGFPPEIAEWLISGGIFVGDGLLEVGKTSGEQGK